jgi:hypothetical protein
MLTSFFVSPKLFGMRADTLNTLSESWKMPQIITSPLFNILCKLPLLVADLLIGLIIYDIVKEKRTEKVAKISFILWFFNPMVIVVDAVQGQFDALPTLMTVLSFCLFFKRNYFASGIAIGLGALFKIYPGFLVPLYLSSIVSMEVKEVGGAEKVKAICFGCLKFIIGLLVSSCLFLVPLVNSNLLHNIFARTRVITSFGGLSPFCIVLLPWLIGLQQLLTDYSTLVSLILMMICFVVIVFIVIISFQGKKDFLKTFVFAHIATIFTIYMTSLTVNSQYVLWVLPFLILSYGLYQDNYNKICVFSIAALSFSIGLLGPSVFYPLSAYTPLLAPQTLLNGAQFFEHMVGWIFLVIGSALGVTISIFCLRDSIITLLKIKNAKISNGQRLEKLENDKPYFELQRVNPSRILTVFFIFLVLGQLLAFTQPLINKTVNFDVLSLEKDKDNVRINYRIKSGNFPTDIQILATTSIITQQIVDKEIVIYYDNNYPSSSGEAAWIGLLDHLPIELKLRNFQGAIKIVNAVDLRREMQTNFNSIIVIPSGILPATVHEANESLVGEWIRAGGTLIWIGDSFAHFSGYSGKVTRLFSTESFESSQNRTLGFVLFNETSTENKGFASKTSDFSKALDLRYPLTSFGAYVSQVLSLGGIVLGKTTTDNTRTAIACLPIGMGQLILFGGGIGRSFTAIGEDVVAHDIAQIICSGVLFSRGTITCNVHELNKDESINGNITVSTPSSEHVGIIVTAFSKSYHVNYFSRKFYIINNG